MPDNPSCLHVLGGALCQTLPLLEIIRSRSPTPQSWEVALRTFTEASRGTQVKRLSDGTWQSSSGVHS